MANSPRLHADRPPAATGEAPTLLDRYVLEEQLGRGHLATVYRATDTVLDRTVAVKILHPHICRDPQFVDEFLEMERRMARLFHPHLVTIFDAGTADDQCFVVMEYVGGGSLRRLLEMGGSLPTTSVVRTVSQVAEALQLLHSQGIIHGEIKPDNVLLDDEGNAKLVDFGIAHLATTTGVIRSDSLARTAPYLAPEQLERGMADARSDIYALGLLAYELLAGRQPFDGDTWIVVATRRLETDPYPLEELRPDLPEALVATIMQALAREPEDRFGSADELRMALQEAAEGRPPPSAVTLAREHTARAPRPSFRSVARRPETAVAESEWERAPRTHQAVAPIDTPAQPTERTEVVPRPAETRRQAPTRRPRIADRFFALDPLTRMLLVGTALIALLLLLGALMLPALTGAVGARGGQAAVKVPDLRGRPLDTARQDLTALGLQVGKVDQREVGDRPEGTVVEQSVRAGAGVAAGRSVDLTVATRPRTSAPKLVDRQLGDAQAELERRGLKLGGVKLQPSADKQAGTVIGQEPPADAQLRQGDVVSVTVAVPPEPKP